MWKPAKTALRLMGARLARDRSALSIFLFHAVFKSADEADSGVVAPQQRITVDGFRRFARHYLEHGYRFVGPDEVLAGLDVGGRYVMATFDDGYYNNGLVVPVLEEFGIPAVFFIVTGNVRASKSFWWDVLHREARRQGLTRDEVRARSSELKREPPEAVEARLVERFGARCFEPVGDVDRPFTQEELRAFATHPLVHLGNHTRDHAILTNHRAGDVEARVRGCQEDLAELCGVEPKVIAYPNGNWSAEVAIASRRVGMELGITVERRKNYVPLDPDPRVLMGLGRFTLWGHRDLDAQCRVFRSDFSWQGLRARRGRPERA